MGTGTISSRWWLGIMLLSVPALASHKSITCNSANFFIKEWIQLRKIEPRLQTFLNDLAKKGAPLGPGGGILTRNCHVEFDVDDQGNLTSFEKGAIVDTDWSLDGGASLYHAGFKVMYQVREENPEVVRAITGVAFCGSWSACSYLSIPFSAPLPSQASAPIGISNGMSPFDSNRSMRR